MTAIRVLFLCTGNSARSIIGAALLWQMGGEAFEVYSAGTHPKGINPYTVRVLEPLGIDLSAERSKNVSEYTGEAFDYVITVCDAAAEECPVFPGAPERIHWSFDDPAAVTGGEDERQRAFDNTAKQLLARLRLWMSLPAIRSRLDA